LLLPFIKHMMVKNSRHERHSILRTIIIFSTVTQYCLYSSIYFGVAALVPPSSDQDATTSTTTSDKSYYQFRHKTVIIPHDDKKFRGGEDAAQTSANFLVVADGVGGWAKHGVNPGFFSRKLVQTIVELGHDKNKNKEAKKSKDDFSFLFDIVHEANHVTAAEHKGSATCTTLQLLSNENKEPMLKTLNVGDSGYSIHRWNGKSFDLRYVSTVGQKRFNFPHQLGGNHGDSVRTVGMTQTHLDLDPALDVIIVVSDGVTDNLYPHQYHDDCLTSLPLTSLSWVADCIARKAYWLGKDSTFDSPFAQTGRESGYYRGTGGKHDDITVVIAQITADSSNTAYDNDIYFNDSITLYTGAVSPDMPAKPAIKEEEEPILVEQEL